MQPPTEEEFNELATELAKRIAGYHPAVQGPVLTNLVAAWLRQYRPADWEKLLEEFNRQVRKALEGSANDGRA